MTNLQKWIRLRSERENMEMREVSLMINYWKMSNFSIRSVWYAYVDHKSYLADSLFVERHVHVTFKEEMMKADSQYRIVLCKVLKKDTAKFEEALDKLKNKMFLLGHTDYPKICDEIEKTIGDGWKGEDRSETLCDA